MTKDLEDRVILERVEADGLGRCGKCFFTHRNSLGCYDCMLGHFDLLPCFDEETGKTYIWIKK